ncbi:hypothetical protein BH11BAC2_BH11BAC2_14870 [soil metagenome]
MNRVKSTTPPQVKESKKAKVNPQDGIARRFVSAINVFSYFDRNSIVKMMPFVFFLTALAIIYIGNSFYAERTIRDIDKTERELKELRAEFITGKSELAYKSKLSEVAAVIQPQGLKESTEAPRKILIKKAKAEN